MNTEIGTGLDFLDNAPEVKATLTTGKYKTRLQCVRTEVVTRPAQEKGEYVVQTDLLLDWRFENDKNDGVYIQRFVDYRTPRKARTSEDMFYTYTSLLTAVRKITGKSSLSLKECCQYAMVNEIECEVYVNDNGYETFQLLYPGFVKRTAEQAKADRETLRSAF